MMEFDDWIAEARAELRKVSRGLDYRAGGDDDLRGYYEVGCTPQRAVAELLKYAAACA
jgi:hypothetical protein